LRAVKLSAKGFEATLSAWIERLGSRATDYLRVLETRYSNLSDTIAEALDSDSGEGGA